MDGPRIKNEFIEFFKNHSHTVVTSYPLVPANDPTLLFTNAGMVQFKDVFTGSEKRSYTRAASVQRCVRAGGKHNDLEVVGTTLKHCTFFEMLGNFSFGDYFKELAIELAWELLTQIYKLPDERLYITIFRDDDEAFRIWNQKIGIPEGKIFRLGEKDNFWAMGDTGPCGPCSEIHYDTGIEHSCGRPECGVDCDCDRFVEVWNLVFMQYNRDINGNLSQLPKPSIDTGMGFERLATIMQNVHSVFDIDLMYPIIQLVEDISAKKYGEMHEHDVAMRVICDHARSTAFLIADGVLPSNEWRGYVLRRILRRGLRYGKSLGIDKPFLYRCTDLVIDLMKHSYPECQSIKNTVSKITLNEEERFSKTLNQGLLFLEDILHELGQKGISVFPGEKAFKLYDTYGLPLDVTREVLKEKGYQLDNEGFEHEMEEQRIRARASWKNTSGHEVVAPVYEKIFQEHGSSVFLGYEQEESLSKLVAIVKDQSEISHADEDQEVELFLDATPAYGESGGQVGDTGFIKSENGYARLETTTIPINGIINHKVKILKGRINRGESVQITIDKQKRQDIRLNHTSTHLLHAGLRSVLGDQVKQAGSLVAPDKFRFDYTHFTQPNQRELEMVEDFVNESVRASYPVQTEVMNLDDAVKSGAMALFGEKYHEKVRVVTINGISKELCGGTHISNTGQIGLFKIIKEGSISSGIRRIEAVTGHHALEFTRKETYALSEISGRLKTPVSELTVKIDQLMERIKDKEKEIEKLQTRIAKGEIGDPKINTINIDNEIKMISQAVPSVEMHALRTISDRLIDSLKTGIVLLITEFNGKVHIVVRVTKNITHRIQAGSIIQFTAQIVGGKGGGRPDMAQAGGTDPSKINQAVEETIIYVKNQLAKNS
ncbi:MAG: alanine--tRNA ligase [Candidatus Schekmanbacteria bacterium RBG_13_48_7]|uniref:Alanine--tRNA ligase n=1 Tax=Candidatus Schekmanbacteria bacterium RBG_13_48_7 TaxID=1817878 RepID=A0A1F7S0R9_9BACT|nr:MAG: alanine--tRNA ligase [Candidatus Schekmanbacteria bacterium RBG_13_48_7]